MEVCLLTGVSGEGEEMFDGNGRRCFFCDSTFFFLARKWIKETCDMQM
jgi:hypothetical protein